jgi:cytochrome b
MRNQKVYDLPVRVFHWVFAGLFATAFIVAKTVDDESYVFSYHMMAGMLLTSTVVMRIVWGFWGTRHSRFAAFALNPKDLFSYFKGILSGDKRKWAGHNPASSWAALAMFALVLALGTTGYLMASGGEETFEDVHEVFAVAFLVIAAGHVAGVALHTFRHRDAIGMSMIDGAKSEVPQSETITNSRPAIAMVFAILVAAFAAYLANSFDPATRTLHVFGTSLQLGESEEHHSHEH